MHGIENHTSEVAVAIIVLIVAIIFLAWFIFRPVRGKDNTPPQHHLPFVPDREETATSRSAERDTFMVIPDISGYTRYISMNRFSSGHAQYVISQLLDVIMEAAHPLLTASRVEGDAIVFYAVTSREYPETGVTEEALARATMDMIRAYYRKRAELSFDNGCPCEACRHIHELDLKVVIHRGAIMRYRLKGLEDLSGFPVIVAHRLLKNSLGMDRYVLVTDGALGDVGLPLNPARKGHSETYEGFEEIVSDVYEFEPEALNPEGPGERGNRLAARTRDIAHKLGKNVDTLYRSAS